MFAGLTRALDDAGGGMRGNLTSISQYSNTTGTWLTSTLWYDIAGNVVNSVDANGHGTGFSFTDAYPDGAWNTYAHATLMTNAAGQQQSWTYDYGSGQVLTARNYNNGITRYAYNDPLERLTNVIRPDGSGNTYSYPNLWEVDAYQDQTQAGDNALRSQTLYDGLGRPFQWNTYESGSGYISVTQSYDALGRVVSKTNPSRPGDGLNYSTLYAYDALGRTTRVTTPDNAFSSVAYSGNTATITDPAGNSWKEASDGLGRLTDVYEDASVSNFHTSYTLDPLNNVRTVTQGSQSRTFVYDSLSRLISAANPESGTTSYLYDNVGNPAQRQDNRGVVTHYVYDALNRLAQTSYSDGTPTVTYSYDGAGIPNSIGQLTQAANAHSITNYTAFDAMGRVTASNQVTAGQTYSFAYGYNLAGALTSETYPSGRVVTTGYDGANRPSTVTGQWAGTQTNYVTSASYQPQGSPSQTAYGNSLVSVWQYDNRLRPVAFWDVINSDASKFLFLEYPSWNTNNNLSGRTTYAGDPAPWVNLPSFAQTFGYDHLNRLTSASDTGGWSQTYSYDPYGNMWMPNVSGLSANGAMPAANVYNGRNQNPNLSYDTAGNQLALGSLSFSYDAENRQSAAANTSGGGTVTYQYDGAGRRVGKALPDGATVYVYDAFGQLAAEYSTAAPGTPPCGTCYLSVDYLGSTRLVTDANANVIGRHDFAPFGQEVPGGIAGRGSLWAANDQINQKFTGQERDQETGLDYFQARYLANSLGRFMSVDPDPGSMDFSNPQSFNRYAYVLGNPLNATDPTGACTLDGNGNAEEDDNGPCYNGGAGGSVTVYSGPLDPIETIPVYPVYGSGNGEGGGSGGGIYTVTGTGSAYPSPQPVSTSLFAMLVPAKTGTPFTKVFLPPNANICFDNQNYFYAPPTFDITKIEGAGKSGGYSPQAMNAAVGHYGTFDFQRSRDGAGNTTFYSGYTPVSNFSVGAYLYSAGFSRSVSSFIANTFALFKSSNAGDPAQATYRNLGYDTAARGQVPVCQAR